MGFQIIQEKLSEKVSKQQFLKECGILLLGVIVYPSLIERLLNKKRFRMIGEDIYLDNQLLIERKEING